MGKKNKLHVTLDAFIAMCDTIKIRYQISFRYKQYRNDMKSCTVSIDGKQFTEWDEKDAMNLALTAASRYMLKTYAIFAELNKQYEELQKENNKLQPCELEFKKYEP